MSVILPDPPVFYPLSPTDAVRLLKMLPYEDQTLFDLAYQMEARTESKNVDLSDVDFDFFLGYSKDVLMGFLQVAPQFMYTTRKKWVGISDSFIINNMNMYI